MNYNHFEGKDVNTKELIDLAETMPFFADRRLILVENSGFFKNAVDEAFVDYCKNCADTACFVFVEDEVDKRTKLFKTVSKEGRAVEFVTQKEETLTRWILGRLTKENKKITGNVMHLFLEKTGTNMDNIDRELEKLICYTMGKEVIEAEDVEAVVTGQVENKIFDMMNDIAEHRQKEALARYYDLLSLEEEPFGILSLLMRQFRILLHVKDMASKGHDQKSIAETVGIPPFAVRKNIAQAKGFSYDRLKEALAEGADLELASKSGRIDKQLAVELLILKYSQ
jgi:DNA polymerase-3 subunit delta